MRPKGYKTIPRVLFLWYVTLEFHQGFGKIVSLRATNRRRKIFQRAKKHGSLLILSRRREVSLFYRWYIYWKRTSLLVNEFYGQPREGQSGVFLWPTNVEEGEEVYIDTREDGKEGDRMRNVVFSFYLKKKPLYFPPHEPLFLSRRTAIFPRSLLGSDQKKESPANELERLQKAYNRQLKWKYVTAVCHITTYFFLEFEAKFPAGA